MNMYNTKEKCMEIARRFEQLCEERGTNTLQDRQIFWAVFLYGKLFPGW